MLLIPEIEYIADDVLVDEKKNKNETLHSFFCFYFQFQLQIKQIYKYYLNFILFRLLFLCF